MQPERLRQSTRFLSKSCWKVYVREIQIAPETSLLIDSFSKEELNYLDKENFVLDDTLIEYQKRLNCNYINKQGEVDGHPGYKSQNGWGDKIYNIIKERFDL